MDLNIGKVETHDEYLDIAFKRAKKRVTELRKKIKKKDRHAKSKELELTRINIIKEVLIQSLQDILDAFPKTDRLDPFYQELIKLTLDFPSFKKSLGALNWAQKQIRVLFRMYNEKIKKTRHADQVNAVRTQFSGRVSSVLKQIRKELAYLEECRKAFKDYPRLKTGMFTVAIAGVPNVGKTTLLKRLTGAKPKIASYPFTTQKLMLGYLKTDEAKIQFIDTPGLLDRPMKKRNPIEKQAALALQHVASVILYVFDITENCGYPLKEQLSLYKELTKNFECDIIAAANKTDMAFNETNYDLLKGIDYHKLSANKGEGVDALRDQLIGLAKGVEYTEAPRPSKADKKREKRKRRKRRKIR